MAMALPRCVKARDFSGRASPPSSKKRLQQRHRFIGKNSGSNHDAMIERPRAHRARLDRHVQGGTRKPIVADCDSRRAERNDLRMRRRIAIGNRAISRRTDDALFEHHNRADRNFTSDAGCARLLDRQMHVFSVGHVSGTGMEGIRYSTIITS
jgi:hypothetical protein